jgi:ubiquinone/menaquinone biosynthesis C-methylase UbiE
VTTHDHHGGAAESTSELAGFLAGLSQLPRRAVDLGCGTGADAVFLAQRGITVTGVDRSESALDHAHHRAERHGVTVAWLQADVTQLPLGDSSIDLALDRGCLHHLLPEEQARYAAEVARVLRPGGTLLVREMNRVGHHEHAIDEHGLQAMIAGTPLTIRSVVTYDGAHGERSGRTMLATLDRVER